MNRSVSFVLMLFIGGAGSALASDPPARKEGLWSVSLLAGNAESLAGPATVYKICRTHEYDESELLKLKSRYFVNPGSAEMCHIRTDFLSGDTYTYMGACVMGDDSSNQLKLTIRIPTETVAHVESTLLTMTGEGRTLVKQISDEKWVGSCPAGAQPGDRFSAQSGSQTGSSAAVNSAVSH